MEEKMQFHEYAIGTCFDDLLLLTKSYKIWPYRETGQSMFGSDMLILTIYRWDNAIFFRLIK